MAWPPATMTSYFVTIVTDHYHSCLKMRADDQRIAIENFSSWSFNVSEKNQKNPTGSGNHPLVRPRVKTFTDFACGLVSFFPEKYRN